jgi:hypothetical protein
LVGRGGFSFTDFARFTAGYEDWGKTTGSSASSTGDIYPLTVSAKGFYLSYAPMIHVLPLISIDPEVGVLYSNVHVGTNFASSVGLADTSTKSGYSARKRFGLGVSVHPPGPFVIGVKYLQIDLPAPSYVTEKIRPNTIILTAQYSF